MHRPKISSLPHAPHPPKPSRLLLTKSPVTHERRLSLLRLARPLPLSRRGGHDASRAAGGALALPLSLPLPMRRVIGWDPAVAAHQRASEVARLWWFLALPDGRYPSPSPYLSPDVAPSISDNHRVRRRTDTQVCPSSILISISICCSIFIFSSLKSLRWRTVITGLRTVF